MEYYYIIGGIAFFILLFVIKHYIWDIPHEEIDQLNLTIKYNQEEQTKELANQKDKYEKELLIQKNKFDRELTNQNEKYEKELLIQKNKFDREFSDVSKRLQDSIFFSETAKSNLRAIPYMAAIMAEYETYGLEKLARKLDWGHSSERASKVKHIREIKKDAEAMVERNKEAYYQLEYLLNMFPNLRDIVDSEYESLPIVDVNEISNYDTTRDYLSKEEYESLSTCERNQLALDRYHNSHRKSKWQIGRDYELYVGYKYSQKGYKIDYFGSYMGLEDLGRDLIAKKGSEVLIIQCKYWSSKKAIHENHINQLFGTMMCYCIENNIDKSKVKGVLITNIELSETAKKMADMLKLNYIENFALGDYPCIKCNINRDAYGLKTKIYHLPFDQQYDATKIDQPGEFMAATVAEAESAGFRRAFKWFNS